MQKLDPTVTARSLLTPGGTSALFHFLRNRGCSDLASTFPDDLSKTDHCLKAKSSLNVGGSMS